MGISPEQFRIRIGNFNIMKNKGKKHFDLQINTINIKCSKKTAPLILLFSLAIIHIQNCRSPALLTKTAGPVKSNIK